MNNKIDYKLSTQILTNGIIHQELKQAEEILSRWLCNTRDASIQDALIKLGWTPPKDSPSASVEAVEVKRDLRESEKSIVCECQSWPRYGPPVFKPHHPMCKWYQTDKQPTPTETALKSPSASVEAVEVKRDLRESEPSDMPAVPVHCPRCNNLSVMKNASGLVWCCEKPCGWGSTVELLRNAQTTPTTTTQKRGRK